MKSLEQQNLRDHMTNLELIFSMLGEEATRTIAVRDDAQGFEDTENVKVVSPQNFLNQLPENDEKE